MRTVLILLGALTFCLGVSTSAFADIIGMNVSASMQIIGSSGPDIGMSITSPTAASVNLTQAGTGMNVVSDMALNTLTPNYAVFDFTIGIHANGYFVDGPPYPFPYLGDLGYTNHTDNGNLTNGMFFRYSTPSVPTTATVTWDFVLSGTNTSAMNVMAFYNPTTVNFLSGPTPVPGHYSGTATYDINTSNSPIFEVSFDPNVQGSADPSPFGIGTMDGQYSGRMTFDFEPTGASPAPEPATALLLLAGLGALGFAARRLTKAERTVE